MQSKYFLRCLGQPGLFAPNGEFIRFRTKKHLALLVYLAVEHRRPHRRDRLAELLWPKAGTAEGRHSLATALSVLRPRLGPRALETSRDQVKLHLDGLSLDIDRLSSRDFVSTDTKDALDVAAFLDGFEIPDAPDYAIWKDKQQGKLLPLIKEALGLLISRSRRMGDAGQVELLADRMLALDDLSEEGIRAKMEARAVAGDRLSALKVFEEWKTRLQDDLGALPSEPLVQIANTLRRGGWERAAIVDIPAVPCDHLKERSFVGRSEEYTILYELWERLKRGHSSHTIVLGDSGIGKTTLVERVTTVARLEGAAVARVQSYDLERSIPFATLGDLTLRLLECPGALAISSQSLSELSRNVPEVRSRFPLLPAPPDIQGEAARLGLTESFCELVSAVSGERPLILVIDDLHLADEASLAVLHLVLRRIGTAQVMTILTARQPELLLSPQCSLLCDSLARSGGLELSLGPLTDTACVALIASLIPPRDPGLPTAVQRALINASGGFPMALELLVQDWTLNGDGAVAMALDAMTADFITGANTPASYGRLFSRLTGSLEPSTRNALDLASVLGRRLNDLPMYSVIDLGLGVTMAALAQLAELRILRDRDGSLEFANELLRAHVYSAIPSPVRKALHGVVSERLIHSKSQEGSCLGLEIAWHSMRAGKVSEAIPHLLEGARQAIRRGAPQSADRSLRTALSTLHGDDWLRATLLLVEALQEQGRWQDSLDVLATLPTNYDESVNSEAFAFAALARGFLATPIDNWLECLPKLRAIIAGDHDISSRVRTARAIAHATANLRDRELAADLLSAIESIPTAELTHDARGHVGLAKALLLFQAGRMEACFAFASALLAELEEDGLASSVVVQLHAGLGAIRGRQGRYAEAVKLHEDALRLATILGNDHLRMTTTANLAMCYGRLGRYKEQLECALSAPKEASPQPATFTHIHIATSVAYAHAAEGRVERMREAFEACERQLTRCTPGAVAQSWLLWKADVLAVAGCSQEAFHTGERAVRDYDFRLQARALAGTFARWAALASVNTGSVGKVRRLLINLEEELEFHDALDQAEILAAKLYCEEGDQGSLRRRLQERLKALPQTALLPVRVCGILKKGESGPSNFP